MTILNKYEIISVNFNYIILSFLFMKKILFLILLLFPSLSYADTLTSNFNWTLNDWLHDCSIAISHWVNHYWIPNLNISDAWTSWWLIACTNHSYYSSSDHVVSIVYNNWWITACPSWEMVVAYNWSNQITCRKYDDTPPQASDVAWSVPSNWSNLLATNTQNFKVNVSVNWGSPITSTKVFFENWNSPNAFLWASHEYVPAWYNENIQNVDSNRVNWSRNYSLQVAKICDEAWNCLCWNSVCNPSVVENTSMNIATSNYNIYANTTLMTWWSSIKSYTEALSNAANIADWKNKNLSITLADTYWNKIVPASWIWRTIDFNFFYNNDLYLNQFTRTWNSAVYTDRCWSNLWLNEFPIWLSHSCNWETWINWVYPYWFKIYTPTDNVDNQAKWNFAINNVTFDVNWTIWAVSAQTLNSWSSIVAKYNPLYTTTLGWSQLSWFIEWVTQNGSLSISTNNPNWVSPSNRWTFLVFGWNTSDYNMKYSKTWNPLTLVSEDSSTLSTDYWTTSWWLVTKLIQTSSTAPTSSNIYLSSHIQYDLDSLTPIYNSDIIWKNNYWDGLYIASQQANQSQLKVYGTLWTTASTKLTSFTSNQWWNAMEVNGGFDKALFKSDILAWATRVVNSIVWNTQSYNSALPDLTTSIIRTTSESKVVGDKKNIILYKGNKLVSFNNWTYYDSVAKGISWKKTIVIYWGDLYINANMYYTDTSSVLGIIVMKDSAWNWWNVYINPNVTNVVWSIYASRSLFSASINNPNLYSDYNSMIYYDWNSDADILKNQLYIYWSLFSANTLGWSKSNPKKCPYYVTGTCDADTAIKYDLNFLRRYYLVDNTTKIPYMNWKIIWWETCNSWWCTNSSTLPQLFTSINYANPWDASYPLIIKYNSNIQTNPPPLFSSN